MTPTIDPRLDARPGASRRASWSRPSALLFLLLLTIHVLPIWAFRYFPSQDGPTTISNARLLWQFVESDRGRIHEFYEINPKPDPTWFGQVLLAGLLWLLRDAALVEKLVLTGYLVLLPLAVRRSLLAIEPEGKAAAFLVFPLLCTFTFHMGFFTFSYSLIVFFWLLSVFIRQHSDVGAWQMSKLTLIALLLFFCHVVTFVLAAFVFLILVLARGGRRLTFRAWRPLLAFAPGALWITALFSFHKRASVEPRPGWNPRVIGKSLAGLVSYRREELPFYWALAGLVLLLAAAVVWRRARGSCKTSWDAFLAVWGLFLLLIWKTPEHVGVIWLLPERIILFVFFGAILWIGAHRLGRGARALCASGSAVLSIGLLSVHVRTYRQFDALLSEYDMAARFVPDNSVVLPLTFAPRGAHPGEGAPSERVAPMLHAAARIGWTRSIVDLDDYQANLRVFPLRFRSGLDPWELIGPIESLPTHLDFLTYLDRTGAAIDYVVVWGLTTEQIEANADAAVIVQQLETGFRPVYRSPEQGLLSVYRSRARGSGFSLEAPSQPEP